MYLKFEIFRRFNNLRTYQNIIYMKKFSSNKFQVDGQTPINMPYPDITLTYFNE
jgi:hypothetical protein